MTEYGTLVLKFSATYSEVEGVDVEELQENIEVRLAELGDIETTFEKSEGEIEFNGILKMDGQRNYTPATWDEPGDSEISVSVDEMELKSLLQHGSEKPFIYISSEEWKAA